MGNPTDLDAGLDADKAGRAGDRLLAVHAGGAGGKACDHHRDGEDKRWRATGHDGTVTVKAADR